MPYINTNIDEYESDLIDSYKIEKRLNHKGDAMRTLIREALSERYTNIKETKDGEQ